jgi:hypothetical protein
VSDGTGLFGASYAITGTGTFALSFVTGGGDPSNLYVVPGTNPTPAVEFAGGTVTVDAVPEPAMIGGLSAVTASMLLRRRGG